MALRLLLADDSAIVRVSLARRFKAAGITVVEADSVAVARAMDPSSVDCALLDFDLGDGYGDELAVHLRAARPELPIAFFTSSTEDETGDRLKKHGDVFAKPDQTEAAVTWVVAQSLSRS